MARKTNKEALKNALQDLSKDKFSEFCHRLRDRRGSPRVSYSDVEDKNVLQITDLMVSFFTESNVLQVARVLLRQINCNQEAETLSPEIKAPVDNCAAGGKGLKAKKKDPILSSRKIEFGKYEGKTFKWLSENDLNYIGFIVANHMQQRKETTYRSGQMANKDSLTKYAKANPKAWEEVKFCQEMEKAKKRSLQPGQEGKALVGFGCYRSMTLEDLYESKNEKIISYVDFIRTTSTPSTKMELAQRYILQRDKEQPAAPNRPNTSAVPKAAKKPSSASASEVGPKQKKSKKAKTTDE
ncbi:uncharacterized protein LOC114561923 isoform X2 [Perca flavescens]|uniref:uncharacterized protein LOC114561923 isoform X2 n=1 Tax=Perca flavescens TaxID=8167 RepID=UPI00106DDC2A|nr:uncharacterized protein LOC114561923 isoform X2 [Perca flavescens]